jgi:hypothetical protein
MSGNSPITSAGFFSGRKPEGQNGQASTSRSASSATESAFSTDHEDLAQSDALEESFAQRGKPSYVDASTDKAIEDSFPTPVLARLTPAELDAVEESFASEGRPSYVERADDQAIDESFAGQRPRRRP